MNQRMPYQGVLQIFQYNRPFYVRTLAGAGAAIAASFWLPVPLGAFIIIATAIAAFWTCSSLLVSHYVYDRSPLYSLRWLNGCLSRPPVRWMNIHAGLDETSSAIASIFPESVGQTLDIFDARVMTEPSIQQARTVSNAPAANADWRALPAPDRQFDAAFLIFTAHELRQRDARARLFQEIARILHADGELILVEHLRDWANFLAFGPGFLHFLSRRTWHEAAHAAGFSIGSQLAVTPFVNVFVLRRPS
jgi:hypothetical protein